MSRNLLLLFDTGDRFASLVAGSSAALASVMREAAQTGVALNFTTAAGQAYWRAGQGASSFAGLTGATVTRASTGYAETTGGVLVPFASGELRRTDRGVLVEGARTNLIVRSQEFDNAAWSKGNATVTANATLAPDGTLTAAAIRATTTGSLEKRVEQTVATVDAATSVGSIYVKAGAVSWCAVTVFTMPDAKGVRRYVNLNNGAIGANEDFNTPASPSFSVTAAGNGWYRVSPVMTAAAGVVITGLRVQPASADATRTYAAASTLEDQIYIWGAQLEAASFPSSYILTTGSTATRAADVVSLGYQIPATATVFVENALPPAPPTNAAPSRQFALGITDAGNSRWALRSHDTSGNHPAFAVGSGAAVTTLHAASTAAAGSIVRTAVRHSATASDLALCVNGATPVTGSSVYGGTGGTFFIGDSNFGYISRIAIVPRALISADLQAVTA